MSFPSDVTASLLVYTGMLDVPVFSSTSVWLTVCSVVLYLRNAFFLCTHTHIYTRLPLDRCVEKRIADVSVPLKDMRFLKRTFLFEATDTVIHLPPLSSSPPQAASCFYIQTNTQDSACSLRELLGLLVSLLQSLSVWYCSNHTDVHIYSTLFLYFAICGNGSSFIDACSLFTLFITVSFYLMFVFCIYVKLRVHTTQQFSQIQYTNR